MSRPAGKPQWVPVETAEQFKARMLRAIDNIFVTELGPEEGSGYVLGPSFKPDTEENMLAFKAWVEAFK